MARCSPLGVVLFWLGLTVAGFSALFWCFCLWALNDCFSTPDIREGLAWTGYWLSGIWHGLVLAALGGILECLAKRERDQSPPPLR